MYRDDVNSMVGEGSRYTYITAIKTMHNLYILTASITAGSTYSLATRRATTNPINITPSNAPHLLPQGCHPYHYKRERRKATRKGQ